MLFCAIVYAVSFFLGPIFGLKGAFAFFLLGLGAFASATTKSPYTSISEAFSYGIWIAWGELFFAVSFGLLGFYYGHFWVFLILNALSDYFLDSYFYNFL